MNKEFYYYDAKYEIDEYGNLARSEYEDDRPHNYDGKIIVLHRHNKRKTIKPFIDKDGYAQVILKSHNHNKHYKIHQLMYLVYIKGIVHIDDMGCGYDFKNRNFIQINHIDGNKLNNYYSNLEIVTLQENISHSIKHKLHNSQRNAKYVEIYKDNVLLGVIWKTREASAWIYNNYGITIHQSTISRCAKYNIETKGFRFKYKV